MNLSQALPQAAAATTDPLLGALARVQAIERVGRVAEAHGTLIRATGLKAAIGELCELRNPEGEGDPAFRLSAEVVGVSKQMTLLTPLGALDGVSATTVVHATGRQAAVRAGDGLLGRILDAHGEPRQIPRRRQRRGSGLRWRRRSTPPRPTRSAAA